MTRRTHAQWQTLFAEQSASGMTVTAFCRERGINPTYFGLRRKQLASKDATTATASDSAFIPVTLSSPALAPSVDILLAGQWRMRVPVGVSPAWLAALLHGLRD